MTRQEILSALKIKNGGSLTEVLDNLIKCDFIRKYTAIGKTEREAVYQLTDLFSLFYLKPYQNWRRLFLYFYLWISIFLLTP